jgi:uncharacterized protein (TIGR03435 family)
MRCITILLAAFCAYGQHFEVASVKLCDPMLDPHAIPRRVSDPGRFERSSTPLASLIIAAYRLKGYQLICPSWMKATRYDVIATIPGGATADEQAVMLQNLFAERLALQVHRETKEMTVYSLEIAKGGPKFQEYKEGDPLPPGPANSEGYPSVPPEGGMSCVGGMGCVLRAHITMEALAKRLESSVGGRPVHDETGLKGTYNLSSHWGQDGGTESSGDGAPVPGGASFAAGLFTALQSQLGLKLESKKGSVEMLVVDHAERVPTEN